jgi:hypothetical protein
MRSKITLVSGRLESEITKTYRIIKVIFVLMEMMVGGLDNRCSVQSDRQ